MSTRFSSSTYKTEKRIRAILGPTNTGKTHLAMERMQAYNSGMIGFPLRLLARENYDRLVAAKGASSVALITGEEKIIPLRPKWYICTVESMPISEPVDFIAIDEIQLCEDRDRGHIFTDRLLHARGRYETMFLGSDTMADLITQLVEEVEIESRPRLSTLRYAGRQKLTRLPRRTAIVAFSVDEVYAIAETVRQHQGGTAVVLGALSPRTRNAQVAMYQAGEVDYLVATDAIGMGLNMDVDHVAFASLRKFDGHNMRQLRPWELGQIAGRAGRHMNDGTFGTTNNLPDIDEEVVELMEEHEFAPITHIQWRNPRLDFKSPKLLLRSLQKSPKKPELMRTRDATDHLALQALIQDEEVMMRATTIDKVQLLWDVCQVPDFRKITPDHHAQFLIQLFLNLADHGAIPPDLIEERLNRLDNASGEIDQLTQRLAHIRSWAYVANRSNWLTESYQWQERTRLIEEKISDALHQSLMLRFVDKRAAMIGRKNKSDGKKLFSSVSNDGEISVEGHVVGHMAGFRFQPDRAKDQREAKKLAAAASITIASYVKEKVAEIETAHEADFRLTPMGHISWRRHSQQNPEETEFVEIARLVKGGHILQPKVMLEQHDISDAHFQSVIIEKLERWLRIYLSKKLSLLDGPKNVGKVSKDNNGLGLSAFARGLIFQLKEGLGSVSRRAAHEQVQGLTVNDRQLLTDAGLRFGVYWIYWKRFLSGDMLRLRGLLESVYGGADLPVFPKKAQLVLPSDYAETSIWPAIGYVHVGPVAFRQDHFEAVMAYLRRENKKGFFKINERLANRIKCNISDMKTVLRSLGCKEVKLENEIAYRLKGQRHNVQPNEDRKGASKKKDNFKAGPELADIKMGRDMVASQQVTNLTKQEKSPVQNHKNRGLQSSHLKAKSKKHAQSSKTNPNSPFAGLKEMLKEKSND